MAGAVANDDSYFPRTHILPDDHICMRKLADPVPIDPYVSLYHLINDRIRLIDKF